METGKLIVNCAPSNKYETIRGKIKEGISAALKLGPWNVRKMIPSFTDNLQGISDTGKTTLIDWLLSRLQMDIVAP